MARPATLADIPVLVELMSEFYAEAGFPLDREWAAAAFVELLSDPARGGAWLVTVDGQVAGHVVLAIRFGMEFGGSIAYIDDLFVRRTHRRRGAATALLSALIADSRRRGCKALHVEVDPANAGATSIYSRFGLAPLSDNRRQLTCRLQAAGGAIVDRPATARS